MHCPFCKNNESKVIDSRISEDGLSIKRRRKCTKCGKRYSTLETTSLMVIKRSGKREEFNKDKLYGGVRKAFQGRPIEKEDLHELAAKVEDDIRSKGVSQIDSYDIGLTLLKYLEEIDDVAYLRFASVYNNYERLADFEKEIKKLRAARTKKTNRKRSNTSEK
ncbi:MAG: transcriptional regulator NrdR [Candidatus Ancillula sp.]|jgi:transcriptional repressor NrdR|nr:transcriptional regulator NrdR [Candidatus Ancillula sp.]